MKTVPSLLAAVVLAAGTASFSIPANAAPITLPSSLQNAMTSPLENVQWRGWGWRGWGPGIAAGAIIGGAFAASRPWYGYNNYYNDYAYAPGYSYSYSPYGTGASGYNSYNYNYPSAYNSFAYVPGYTYGYRVAEDAVAYCKQRFRSYNVASGTYLGYDGLRHACP
jgi:BA14K-like protein